MTNVLIQNGQSKVLETIEIPADVDVHSIPRRPYDYSKGDRRFFGRRRALEHANEEARRTGIRQVVRVDPTDLPGQHRAALFLVQAVGS